MFGFLVQVCCRS